MLTFLACRVDCYITQTCSHNNRQLLIWVILQRTADYMFLVICVESRVTIFHFNVMAYLVTDGHFLPKILTCTS